MVLGGMNLWALEGIDECRARSVAGRVRSGLRAADGGIPRSGALQQLLDVVARSSRVG
jgi:hypothetical protein